MKCWASGLRDATSLPDDGKERTSGFSVPSFSDVLDSWCLPANRVDRSKVGLQSLIELPSHFGVTSIVGQQFPEPPRDSHVGGVHRLWVGAGLWI